MKKYDPVVYIYILAMWVGLTTAYQTNQFRIELRDFKGSIVYDIDKVRSGLMEEMQYMYGQGCRFGTDYPEEYKLPTVGFNTHSPSYYCGEEFDKTWKDYMYEKVSKIGRN